MQEMGDLHSMAYHYYSNSLNQQHNSNSLCWDPHNFGVFNADHSSSSIMDRNPSVFSSDFDSDLSTGYLQDALVEFHDRSKRRRVFLYSDQDQTKSLNFHSNSYWNSNLTWDFYENLNCLSQLTANNDKVSDEPIISTSATSRVSEEANIFTEMDTTEEEISAHEESLYFSSPDSYKENSVHYTKSSDSILLSGLDDEKRRKKKMTIRMVCPFEVVKPGGVEGDMTLNDINERILMPPTRPVRHPVGDFACRPSVVSANGPGLSGKAVVALTRIHTQGRGTITIIRTKG